MKISMTQSSPDFIHAYTRALEAIARLACPHLHTAYDETGGPEPWEKWVRVICLDCMQEVMVDPVLSGKEAAEIPL